MIAELKLNPNMTLEYEHYLGGPLVMTHWLEYDSNKGVFYDSVDNDYCETTEAKLYADYTGHWWRRT